MSSIKILNKIQLYNKPHCYQYEKKLQTLEEDKALYGWSDEDIANIKISDFKYRLAETEAERKVCRDFIRKYEWMEEVSQFNTHYFQAFYGDKLGCVVIFSQPNAFSKMMGEDTKYHERLISRGASASWTPKCLASNFLSWCMKWMAENTEYYLFTAYSDVQAKEMGTIYQSLNFYCLGQGAGTSIRCINPFNPEKVVSDRAFRSRSFFKRYAKDLGIEWQKNWSNDQSMLWENIPDDVEQKLREYSKEMFTKAEKIKFPKKWKYAYVLGKDKRETRELRKKFLELNKTYPYPKERGK